MELEFIAFAPLSCAHAQSLPSCLTLCDPMNCSRQAPLSLEFSRQEYWSGLSCPPPGAFSPRHGTRVSCIAGRFFLSLSHGGKPLVLPLPFLESSLFPLILTLYGKCGRAGGHGSSGPRVPLHCQNYLAALLGFLNH